MRGAFGYTPPVFVARNPVRQRRLGNGGFDIILDLFPDIGRRRLHDIAHFSGGQRPGDQRDVFEHAQQVEIKIAAQELCFRGKAGFGALVHRYFGKLFQQLVRPENTGKTFAPELVMGADLGCERPFGHHLQVVDVAGAAAAGTLVVAGCICHAFAGHVTVALPAHHVVDSHQALARLRFIFVKVHFQVRSLQIGLQEAFATGAEQSDTRQRVYDRKIFLFHFHQLLIINK
jgi:hypothetical protein